MDDLREIAQFLADVPGITEMDLVNFTFGARQREIDILEKLQNPESKRKLVQLVEILAWGDDDAPERFEAFLSQNVSVSRTQASYEERHKKILDLKNEGKSLGEIAKLLSIPKSTVQTDLERHAVGHCPCSIAPIPNEQKV